MRERERERALCDIVIGNKHQKIQVTKSLFLGEKSTHLSKVMFMFFLLFPVIMFCFHFIYLFIFLFIYFFFFLFTVKQICFYVCVFAMPLTGTGQHC